MTSGGGIRESGRLDGRYSSSSFNALNVYGLAVGLFKTNHPILCTWLLPRSPDLTTPCDRTYFDDMLKILSGVRGTIINHCEGVENN